MGYSLMHSTVQWITSNYTPQIQFIPPFGGNASLRCSYPPDGQFPRVMCNGRHGSIVGMFMFIFPFGGRDTFFPTYDCVLIMCIYRSTSGHLNPARILTQRFTTWHNTSNPRHADINYTMAAAVCFSSLLNLSHRIDTNSITSPLMSRLVYFFCRHHAALSYWY